mmetsp:Transcript_90078/g.255084  ORF Transcript_90078/g.255084 Transcript_90078/m.255084 type:complete len:471 (+) Transcript_90078:47-1459(+)
MAPAVLALSIWAALLRCVHSVRISQGSLRVDAKTAVQVHGQLRVARGRIVDESGKPVRLRGMSLFYSQWGEAFYNARAVQWLAEDWNATVVRATMGVEHGGYLSDPDAEREKIEAVVQAAIAAGIYVIIDWHDAHAHDHIDVAGRFFDEMAEKYGSHPNVLFEPYCEPEDKDWSATIKPYHEALVKVIRKHTPNMIIIGTPHWDQYVDVAANDPVNDTNLAYALHFEAPVHGEWLRQKVSAVLEQRVAIFVSGWTMGNSSERGSIDFRAAQVWMDFLANHSISDVNWALFDGKAHSSALQAPTLLASGWAQSELSGSGRWVRASLRGESPPPPPCEMCAAAGQNCRATGCCAEPGMTCYAKDEYFATCKETCTPGIDPKDSPNFQTSWSCKAMGGACAPACAATGANCKSSQCCEDRSLTCFEKDQYFSACKASCTPGIDPKDPAQYRSPWSCASPVAAASAVASSTALP